jgi:hypothetical protein
MRLSEPPNLTKGHRRHQASCVEGGAAAYNIRRADDLYCAAASRGGLAPAADFEDRRGGIGMPPQRAAKARLWSGVPPGRMGTLGAMRATRVRARGCIGHGRARFGRCRRLWQRSADLSTREHPRLARAITFQFLLRIVIVVRMMIVARRWLHHAGAHRGANGQE